MNYLKMKLCLQILTYGLMLGYLVSADRPANCQRVPVNNGRIQGECCIFVKERPKDLQEELMGLLDPKLSSQMFLQHEAHSAEDVGKAMIGLKPLHNERLRRPLDKPSVLIIEHHHKNHQAPHRTKKGHHRHEHIASQETSQRYGSASPNSFIGTEGQTPATESNHGGKMTNVTTESRLVAEDKTTGNVTVGKTALGNRNAVDVPVAECPAGEGRDPSGRCVSEFF